MTKKEFIDSVANAGWSALCDAQHERIEAVWRQLFPKDAALEDMITECSRLEELLTSISDLAHANSTGPAVPDTLWEIRQLANQR